MDKHEEPHEEGSIEASKVPTLPMMRGRILLGLILGVVGICLGVVGVVFASEVSPVVTVVASICAVAGCFVIGGVTLLPLLTRAQEPSTPFDADPSVQNGKGSPKPSTADSVIDPITDLPDGRYFEVAIDSRVAAARRHLWPVSIVLLEIGFEDPNTKQGAKNAALSAFADLMRKTLREADIACRLSDTSFGLILEDTSEEGGVWTAERLQIALSHDVHGIRRLVAGVAAYPTHGLYSKDVLVRARAALARASATPSGHGFGQVEVAHVDLS